MANNIDKKLVKNHEIYSDNQKKFLLELLKIRTNSLVSYSYRVWQMFNWFVTINIGIFGFIFSKQNSILNSLNVYLVSLLLNILWLYIGINDYLSMKKHKTIKEKIEEELYYSHELGNLFEELSQNENPIFTRWKFNQTKTLFMAPLFCIILWIIIYSNI